VHSRSHDFGHPVGNELSSRLTELLPVVPVTMTGFAGALQSRELAADSEFDANLLAEALLRRVPEAPSAPMEIALLFKELTRGRWRIACCFSSDESFFVALTSPDRITSDRRLASKRLDVLEKVLLYGGQKPVAAELGLAPSTVAIIAGNCLRAMGLDCGASRAPVPLALAVHAQHEKTSLTQARLRTVTHAGRTYTVVSTQRPEVCLSEALSRAEFAVTRLLLEGKTHAEISAIRRTSVRTVANQLAAAFHKLGVSGRSELVCYLVNPDFEPLSDASACPDRGREQPLLNTLPRPSNAASM
jgi:DNA-binding CsgD family transcriptional regulator